eukprot:COSAG01_NODE_3521_length_5979_cov_3.817347_4_plen_43_part_00
MPTVDTRDWQHPQMMVRSAVPRACMQVYDEAIRAVLGTASAA